MKTILLLGAGKSATVLIDYLITSCAQNKWKFIVADINKAQVVAKTGGSVHAEVVEIDVHNEAHLAQLIQRAHVVISMMPPDLHFLIAKDCVEYRKHLLTASYINHNIQSLKDEIRHRKLLFIGELGLDPGIDHMSAMQLINGIKAKGGNITSFKSHCGGLIAPANDDNPWRYKISWNPRNVVLAGKDGADYKLNNQTVHTNYNALFKSAFPVTVDGLDTLSAYPNRDSLSYLPLYKLPQAHTIIRTTLRYPCFMEGWDAVVQAGLTNPDIQLNTEGLLYSKWAEAILPFVNEDNKKMLDFLGLFSQELVPKNATTSAEILQFLLEKNLAMQPQDKDMIVLLHEVEYTLNGKRYQVESSLIVEGEDAVRTAMAKTVGLPLGIAAKLILEGKLNLRGLHLPVIEDIYMPVLKELDLQGIRFTEREIAV